MEEEVADEQDASAELPALFLQELIPTVEAEEKRHRKGDIKGVGMRRFAGERKAEIEQADRPETEPPHARPLWDLGLFRAEADHDHHQGLQGANDGEQHYGWGNPEVLLHKD
jgi:hypothetical protein